MERLNYRRLHDELVAVQSDNFKHYFEQVTKIGCNLYRCSMSICHGDQSYETVGFGTSYIISTEEASSSLIDKLMANNLLNKNLVNVHQQQLEEEKRKVNELTSQLRKEKEMIESFQQRIFKFEEREKTLIKELISMFAGQSLFKGLTFNQENDATSFSKITEELKKFISDQTMERCKLQKLYEENNKTLTIKTEEIKQLKTDLMKANDIIRKLHESLKNANYKINILNEVASKQDEAVDTKEMKIKRLEADLKICLERLKRKECEIESTKNEIKLLRSRCETTKNEIKTNENIITWLNKQLTEARLKDDLDLSKNRRTSLGGTDINQESTTIHGRVFVPELPRINLTSKPDNEKTINPSRHRKIEKT